MHRIHSIEDQMNRVATYQLSDGQHLRISYEVLERMSAAEWVRKSGLGHLLPTKRLPVMQAGRFIGSMAPDFDPSNIKSTSLFYDPRPGDFRLESGAWIASNGLGAGDLEAIKEFSYHAPNP